MTRHLLTVTMLVASSAVPACGDELQVVVDRYVAWRGGTAYEQLHAMHMQGTLHTSGLHGPEEIWTDADAHSRVAYDLGALKQTQVVTSEQTWESTPSGQVETMSQGDILSLRRDEALQFAYALRGGRGLINKTVLMPSETRDGQLWAVVRVTFGDEDTYDAFIHPQTGALAGFRIVEDRQRRFEGFDDWRTVDGVRMPFLLTTKSEAPGDDSTFEVAAVELNQPIAASLLARPKAVELGTFAGGASSTGWISFEFFADERIFFSAKINGHDVVALLDSGATMSSFDKAFANSAGLQSKEN